MEGTGIYHEANGKLPTRLDGLSKGFFFFKYKFNITLNYFKKLTTVQNLFLIALQVQKLDFAMPRGNLTLDDRLTATVFTQC